MSAGSTAYTAEDTAEFLSYLKSQGIVGRVVKDNHGQKEGAAMAKKKKPAPQVEPVAVAEPAGPLHAIAAEFGVGHADVAAVADMWLLHHQYQVVPHPVLTRYAEAHGRMNAVAGPSVHEAVNARVRAHAATLVEQADV